MLFLVGCFGLGYTRHSEVTEVVVGFARTGDGHNNHWQGAAFARAEMELPEAIGMKLGGGACYRAGAGCGWSSVAREG